MKIETFKKISFLSSSRLQRILYCQPHPLNRWIFSLFSTTLDTHKKISNQNERTYTRVRKKSPETHNILVMVQRFVQKRKKSNNFFVFLCFMRKEKRNAFPLAIQFLLIKLIRIIRAYFVSIRTIFAWIAATTNCFSF